MPSHVYNILVATPKEKTFEADNVFILFCIDQLTKKLLLVSIVVQAWEQLVGLPHLVGVAQLQALDRGGELLGDRWPGATLLLLLLGSLSRPALDNDIQVHKLTQNPDPEEYY